MLINVTYENSLKEATAKMVWESAKDLVEKQNLFEISNAILTNVHLTALNRIGGEDGYSGSQVFVASLKADVGGPERYLLLKVVEGNIATATKLVDEWVRYGKVAKALNLPYIGRVRGLFPPADDISETRLLWTDLMNENAQIDDLRPDAIQPELRHHIEEKDWKQVNKSLDAAYKILSRLHNYERRLAERNLLEMYQARGYLRNHDSNDWINPIQNAIRDNSTQTVFGKTIANPLRLLKRLEKNSEKCNSVVFLGGVHGDFHPRNVLVGTVANAMIIDFGWANTDFHTIIDFVLMEVSIKFFYMPWSVNCQELADLEEEMLLHFDLSGISKLPTDDWLREGLLALTKAIRNQAKKYIDFSSGTSAKHSFALQYLLPMYFVTLGTFKYAASVKNLEYLKFSAGMLAQTLEAELFKA